MVSPAGKLRAAILELLARREAGKSICPSEAARHVFPEDWRSHMDLTRKVAVELAGEGKIEICQKGHPVNPATARGPVRLRAHRADENDDPA